jgi:hypothetical protein
VLLLQCQIGHRLHLMPLLHWMQRVHQQQQQQQQRPQHHQEQQQQQ